MSESHAAGGKHSGTDADAQSSKYEVDIRNIDVEYSPVHPYDVGRETDDAGELSLSTIVVQVNLRHKDEHWTYAISFDVDHEWNRIELSTVGDAHNKRQSFGAEALETAIEHGERAVLAIMPDLVPSYDLEPFASDNRLAGVDADPVVHQALEVADE